MSLHTVNNGWLKPLVNPSTFALWYYGIWVEKAGQHLTIVEWDVS